jgi:hypothetical protein
MNRPSTSTSTNAALVLRALAKFALIVLLLGLISALGAYVLRWQTYDRHVAAITSTISFTRDACPATHPLRLEIDNKSVKTIEYMSFEVLALDPDRGTIVTEPDPLYEYAAGLPPARSSFSCYQAPPFRESIADPGTLRWSMRLVHYRLVNAVPDAPSTAR